MRVAVLYEESGIVRDAFAARGHDAISVDLRPARCGGPHAVADVFGWLASRDAAGLDLAIAHPTCTYLNSAGLHWNVRNYGREMMTRYHLEHVRRLFAMLDEAAPKWAVENPIGCIGTEITPATQTIQPFNFGEDASKATCLWLRRLPRLRATGRAASRIVDDGRAQLGLFGTGVERWGNQTDSGQNRLVPSADRWSLRSTTYQGIADAMAEQWG